MQSHWLHDLESLIEISHRSREEHIAYMISQGRVQLNALYIQNFEADIHATPRLSVEVLTRLMV